MEKMKVFISSSCCKERVIIWTRQRWGESCPSRVWTQ